MTVKTDPQLALDERALVDAELEATLEERLRHQAIANETRKAYDEAHERAIAEIAKLELPEGHVVRCGRFRITRTAVPARSVNFETKASSRVRIRLMEED